MTGAGEAAGEEAAGGRAPESADSDAADDEEAVEDEHLQDVPAGAGCTDIWEHLSEERRDDDE